MKRRIWLLGALAVAGLLALGVGAAKSRSGTAATTQAADSTVHTVGRGEVLKSISSTGKIVSNLDVDIKCRASGEVVKLPFDISDAVSKGQLLLELDPVDQERDVRKAQIVLAQSEAKLAQAQQNLLVAKLDVDMAQKKAEAAIASAEVKSRTAQLKAQRRQELVKEKLGSAEDLETSEVEAAAALADLANAKVQADDVQSKRLTAQIRQHELELAQAQLSADQISLENAKQQLVYTHVEAPMDGVVSARNIQIGTIISSGITNIGGGTTIMTLSDVSRLFVLASVDEADIGQVQLGQRSIITVDAFPNERFDGKVIRIATTGVNTSNVVTFEVKVEVTSANKKLLKPVMTASVQIISGERHGVLIVPEQSVVRGGSGSAVELAANGTQGASERAVVLGLSDGENVEVTEGLAEGQQVIVRKEAPSKWSKDSKSTMPPPPPN